MLALPCAHNGSKHLDPRIRGQGHDLIRNLINGLLANLFTAIWAVGHADSRPQQAQIIIDLRDGAYGGAGIMRCCFLVNGDGRREPLNGIDVGLVQLAEKLPGIGGQRLDISALPFGIDRVKRQRALAGPGDAGQHHQFVAWNLNVYIPKIVGTRAPYAYGVSHQHLYKASQEKGHMRRCAHPAVPRFFSKHNYNIKLSSMHQIKVF